jgi:uncharacterized membrane protein
MPLSTYSLNFVAGLFLFFHPFEIVMTIVPGWVAERTIVMYASGHRDEAL